MTPARLDEIVAAMRSDGGCAASVSEVAEALYLATDIAKAERALREAIEAAWDAASSGTPDGTRDAEERVGPSHR